MTDYKERVGTRSKEFRFRVTPERIAAFRGAVHAPAGARGHGHWMNEAPPTFLTIARDGEFELLQTLGVPLKKLLHGEQEYEYVSALLAGDELVYSTVLAQALEKKGGAGSMTFLILESEFTVVRGGATVQIGSARTNLVVREGAGK